jgi:ribonuclease HI
MPFTFWLTNFDRVPYIKVYTHGACDRNGQPGAVASAAVYFGYNGCHNWYSLDVPGRQTNRRADLAAVIHALEIVVANRDKSNNSHQRVAVFTNSNYPKQVWDRGLEKRTETTPNNDLARLLLGFNKHFLEVLVKANLSTYILPNENQPPLELLTCKSAMIFWPAIIRCQQNPPDASKSSSHFYGQVCHLQTAGFHYGGMRARLIDASIGITFFFMATCGRH